MSRFNIFEEGDYFMVGGVRRDMDPIVVECAEEPLPLIWMFDFQRKPLGEISDIRIENGNISGEVTWTEPGIDDNSFAELNTRLGGFYTDVEERKEGKTITVTKATLRGVSMVMREHAANPGASL